MIVFANCHNLQHQNLLRDKLRARVVIRATTLFNLQRNNVARQVVQKCCPYYLTFTLQRVTHNEKKLKVGVDNFIQTNVIFHPKPQLITEMRDTLP